jgi:phosphomannomutase
VQTYMCGQQKLTKTSAYRNMSERYKDTKLRQFDSLPQDEFMPVYAAHLRGIIKRGVDDQEDYEHPLRGFHIVVDAGNGGGGYFAYDVLQPLGANIEGRQPWWTHP